MCPDSSSCLPQTCPCSSTRSLNYNLSPEMHLQHVKRRGYAISAILICADSMLLLDGYMLNASSACPLDPSLRLDMHMLFACISMVSMLAVQQRGPKQGVLRPTCLRWASVLTMPC